MRTVCQFCETEFESVPAAKRKFCSRGCFDKSRSKRIERTCESCGKSVHRYPYHAAAQKHVFCSRECYGLWKRKRVTRTCSQCGERYTTKPSKNTVYCSLVCFDAARAQKMSTFACEQCGLSFERPESFVNDSMYRGRFCSSQCMGKSRRKPDNWRSEYNHEFTEALKEKIRNRDSYTCQSCGIHQAQLPRALDVHHISGDKTDNRDGNLISLCNSCHSSITIRDTLALLRDI